jgi:hypothetical protein
MRRQKNSLRVEEDTGAILSESQDHHPQKKRNVQLGDAFEDTAFNPGFEIVKF